VKNERRVDVLFMLAVRRPGWTVNLLEHPDGEPPSTHNRNGDNWPDKNCQNDERKKF